jgi:hypothetical protein
MDWLMEVNVSEKRAVSIFKAEVNYTKQSTWLFNPKNIIIIVTAVKNLSLT